MCFVTICYFVRIVISIYVGGLERCKLLVLESEEYTLVYHYATIVDFIFIKGDVSQFGKSSFIRWQLCSSNEKFQVFLARLISCFRQVL